METEPHKLKLRLWNITTKLITTRLIFPGCRVSPECFGHMTALLSGLAEGHVVLALEGGYNLTTISYCMTLCAKALLGDPLPPLEPQLVPNKSAVQTINDVIRTHSRYWPTLCFQVGAGILNL